MDYELRAARARKAALTRAAIYPPPETPERLLRPIQRPASQPRVDLWAVANAVMTEVGNAIPDCDPWERLAPFLRRMGVEGEDVTRVLNRACQKYFGVSYTQYLIDAWDGWNQVCEPDQRMGNPWK